jgi:acetyl esterase/lipase
MFCYPFRLRRAGHRLALLDQGTPPNQIVIAGHSAGRTLTLSALQALRDAGRPMPAAAITLSPLTDFTFSAAATFTTPLR